MSAQCAPAAARRALEPRAATHAALDEWPARTSAQALYECVPASAEVAS